MDTTWQHTKDLFQAALEQPAETRQAFLDERCDGDPRIRQRVCELLAAYDDSPAVLKDPAAVFGLRDEPVEAGQRLARFTIRRVIAAGGMSIVYEAQQDDPKRTVALKVLRGRLLSDSALLRLRHEADVLARLTHPNIARVFETGTLDGEFAGRPYFAMEYVDGRTLRAFIKDEHVSIRERLALFVRVCEAVHHAHQKGVIHRDIKPENIVIDERGEPKVLDFGVARVTDAGLRPTTLLTRMGDIVGTLAHMSPEQAAGEIEAIDVGSDVYSLGVVLYELLADRLPYEVRSKPIHEAVQIIREYDPAPLGETARNLRGDLTTITAKALEKNPARRYVSAFELAADVRRHLENQPIQAQPAGIVYQLVKLGRRRRGLVIGIAAVTFALALGVAGIVRQSTVATRQRDRAVEAERRATKRFDQVHELASRLIFDVHDKIVTLPGAINARRVLVETALDYLDSLSTEAGDNLKLKRDLAAAYERLGDVLGGPAYANVGRIESALDVYRKAKELRQAIVGANPGSTSDKLELAKLWRREATAHQKSNTSETILSLNRAIEILAEIAADDPDSADVTCEQIAAKTLLARMRARSGRTADALEILGQAVAVGEALLQLDPSEPRRRTTLQNAYQQLGLVQETAGQTAAALVSYQESLNHAAQLAADDEHSVNRRRNLASGHMLVGDTLANTGRADEAVQHFRESLSITLELARTNPNDVRVHADLGYAHERIGYDFCLLAVWCG